MSSLGFSPLSSLARSLRWCAVLCLTRCTLLSDFDIGQCKSDADCNVWGGSVRYCNRARCVEGCLTNRHCSSFDPRTPICTARGGACGALTTTDGACFASSQYDDANMGHLTGEEMVLVGAFASSRSSSAAVTMQLAADEINDSGGLPGATQRRPLMLILCDEAFATGAATHLLDELRVHAVVGSLEDSQLQAIAARGSAFFLSPGGPGSTRLNDESDFVWYLGARYLDVAGAYVSLVQRVIGVGAEARVPGEAGRVAAIVGAASEDRQLAQAVMDQLVEAQPADPVILDRFDVFGDSAVAPAGGNFVAQSQELQRLIDFAPSIVLLFAGGAYSVAPESAFTLPPRPQRASVLRALVAPVNGTTALQPFFVLGPRNMDDSAPRRLAVDSPEFRSRAVLLRGGRTIDDGVSGPVRARFAQAFPQAVRPESGMAAALTTYDAIYYLAYAVAAAPEGTAPTRESIRSGFLRVTDRSAERVDVGPGPTGFDRAIVLLDSGASFNLHGSDGPADFDLDEHARSGPTRLYCWNDAGEAIEFAGHDSDRGNISSVAPLCSQDLEDVLGE